MNQGARRANDASVPRDDGDGPRGGGPAVLCVSAGRGILPERGPRALLLHTPLPLTPAMRLSALAALGGCQAAAALSQTTAMAEDPTPPSIDGFDHHGCARLSGSFQKVSTSDQMSLDFCAASCPSQVFGVYSK